MTHCKTLSIQNPFGHHIQAKGNGTLLVHCHPTTMAQIILLFKKEMQLPPSTHSFVVLDKTPEKKQTLQNVLQTIHPHQKVTLDQYVMTKRQGHSPLMLPHQDYNDGVNSSPSSNPMWVCTLCLKRDTTLKGGVLEVYPDPSLADKRRYPQPTNTLLSTLEKQEFCLQTGQALIFKDATNIHAVSATTGPPTAERIHLILRYTLTPK